MLKTLFYRAPRLTVLAILIVVAGAFGAAVGLGRQEDPTLIERFGYTLTTFPGADAERVEALITEPIEAALLELKEINELESTSRAGVSQIQISMREDLPESDVDEAWTLVRQQIDLAAPSLPDGASDTEVVRQFLGASTLLVSLSWSGDGEPPLTVLTRLADDLEDRFRALPGTESTQVYGEIDEEIRVVVDPDQLAAAGLTAAQAARLIASADAKAPAGQVRADSVNVGLEVAGAFESISRIRAVPLVQRPDGTALRVGDVAEVRKSRLDPPDSLAVSDGRRAVQVGVFIEPNLRVDQWAERARAMVDAFAAAAPAGVDVDIVFDQSAYTEARLAGLARNLLFSALLVVIVLFFALGWRAALVVGSALPLTVCLVLILFNLFGMPLHQMSVTGLVISLGLLIDNAIVVVDEFQLRRRRGMGVRAALDDSIGHLAAPLFASTLTTALAFAPIALLPGSAGEFIGMMGVAVIFAVSSSLLLSLTVIPAFAGWFDEGRRADAPQRFWRDGMTLPVLTAGYRWTLKAVLRYPVIGLAAGATPAIIGFALAQGLPMQFFPPTERDQFQIEITLPPETSIAQTQRVTERATELIKAYPGVEEVYWTIGTGAPRVYYNAFNTQNGVSSYAAGHVEVVSTERTRILLPALQKEVRDEFPEAQFLTLPYEQGPPVTAPIEVFIIGPDLSVLNAKSEELRGVLGRTPGVTYTQASISTGAPKLTLNADETAADLAGVRLSDIAADLSAELEGVPAGSILEGVEDLPVRVVANNARRGQLSDLSGKIIGGRPGDLGAPLSTLGDLTLDPDIAVISRLNAERMSAVLGFLEPYALPAPALNEFEALLEQSGFELPDGYRLQFGGEASTRGQAMGDLFATAGPLILAMLGCVTLVFNSFRLAGLVFTTGALSLGMAFFGVWLFDLPMGFTAIVGGLGLLGIAINGAIVVLSALTADKRAVAGDAQAIEDVTVDATRHIVATTFTTIGGFTPLILSGDGFWLPLATGVAGGVAGSAVLALYFTPAAFKLLGVGRKAAKDRLSAPSAGLASPAAAE